MSCIKLNLTDHDRTISGEVHGSIGDAVIASLSAEPETIHELELAIARFQRPTGGRSVLASLRDGEDFEPYDAGIVIVDLAAQVVMIDSTYSIPAWVNDRHTYGELDFSAGQNSFARSGQAPETFAIGYHDGEKLTDLRLPYRLVDTWQFVGSVPEYEGIYQKRRAEKAAHAISERFDARSVLFGKQLSEFVATEILHAPNLEAEDLFTEIHARWLMTPRKDLQGRTPRDWLLAKKEFIDFDLQSRELQWSFTGECPPPLLPTAHAYRFAGFGTHEIVIYYDLIRLLLDESGKRACEGRLNSVQDETERLERIKSAWLEAPDNDDHGKPRALIIDWERRRIPLAMSGKEAMIDEDCPVCQAIAEDREMLMFWHLDGCNMDEQFEFSFFMTREEWEADRHRIEEFSREFDRKWKGDQARQEAGSVADHTEPF